MLIEQRQALISYQGYHILLLTLAGRGSRLGLCRDQRGRQHILGKPLAHMRKPQAP